MNDEITKIIEINGTKYAVSLPKEIIKAFSCIDNELSVCSDDLPKILDYIHNLQDEIKEWEYLQDIQDQREYHKKYLEERRKEQPNLLYPDFDEIYKRFFELRDRIDKAVEYIENDIDLTGINGFERLLQILRGNENE